MSREAVGELIDRWLNDLVFRAELRADRATLFLVDETRGELRSKVAQSDGGGPLEIRLPVGVGIAGRVAALWQFAFVMYLIVLFNLNPLREYDGYYWGVQIGSETFPGFWTPNFWLSQLSHLGSRGFTRAKNRETNRDNFGPFWTPQGKGG